MKDDITQPPAEGVYVYGLYLEGAGWDRRNCKLIDSKPKVLFEMMPVIRMYAENNGEIDYPRTLQGGKLPKIKSKKLNLYLDDGSELKTNLTMQKL